MQNLPDGPRPAGNLPDDQFGEPEPDNAHLTGLNDDGTTPQDNPFVRAGALRGGEAGTNLQKVFDFGITESESLLFGTGFGISTDIQTGPNGNLYVVSLSSGNIYEIFREPKEKK